ncbi:hypothetical protein [Delftia sp. HK171]|uniref:hypothetical protein n=1 Tax=Delftia sp. HK171 TaxID=1920191 RepID=UPI001151792A|nr:hypothetical protein [Delftia sp. HK171]
MDSIWQVVLTSSVVSTGLSTGIAFFSKYLVERRQEGSAAQILARELEAYVRACAREIKATDAATDRAVRVGNTEPLDSRDLPAANFQLVGIDRLDPIWRDRIASFPERVAEKKRWLAAQWPEEDPMEYMDLLQDAEAELGRAAYRLAAELRQARKLPTTVAAEECRAALDTFADIEKRQQDRAIRVAAYHASFMQGAGLSPQNQNNPAGSEERSQL